MINVTCPSDEELIPILVGESATDSIESHLQTCSVCKRRMDIFRSDLAAMRSVPMPATGPMSGVSEEPPPPARPSRIGKYLVVGTLDSGGQAEVYRAVHPTLDKELAIKLSRRAVGRLSDHRPLLVAEGKLLAKLDHPGLARVYDLDFHDDLPFLAMEFVRGPNLRQYAKDSPVSPKAAAEIVAEVARALVVVHKHGVVHQDVKPQNVLIDETGRPRLIDFGMARLRHAWDDSGERTSGGTPAFMAPEQARGEDTAVGPRADIFGLGAVLYFLLTGKPPFMAPTVTETLAVAGRCEFDRSALDKAGIPRGLREICLKAMSANPADRYGRAEDLADAIDRHLTRPRRLAKWAGAAIAASLAAGLGVAAANGVFTPRKDPTVIVQKQDPPAAPAPVPLEVFVTRDGNTLPLLQALPLDAQKDRLQVIARVPPGHHAALLHLDARGKATLLPVRESPADGFTRLVYPKEEGRVGELDGPPGTEFLLVVAAEKQEALDQVEEATRAMLVTWGKDDLENQITTGLPPLPAKTLIWLGRDEPKREQKPPLRSAEIDPVAVAEYKLDQLRQKFLERKSPLSVFRGVAYRR